MANIPRPAVTAAVPPNAEGSNKSVPAPVVAVPAGVKKWLSLAMVTVAIVTTVAIIASVARSGSSEPKSKQAESVVRSTPAAVPLANTAPAAWPKLVIPPGGKSEMISIPLGMYIVMDGKEFVLHTVYMDGRDCSFEESGVCPAGAYAGSYARNKASETNTVSYAFAPVR